MSDRAAAFAFGLHGEALAAWALRLKGYRVLARRSRHHVGEIDLIARRGNVLAFIEVKSRRNLESALEAITANQRRRIERAAQAFVQRHPALARCDWRFDVMVVGPGALGGVWPRHLPDAWRPDS